MGISLLGAVEGNHQVSVLLADSSVEDEARQWLWEQDERTCSFVDGVSPAIIRRRRIRQALAFVGDFSAAGYVEVRLP